MTDILTTKELGKNFKNKHVLNQINIHVPEGKKFTALWDQMELVSQLF